MPFTTRHFCFALLLILLVSHVSVAAHVATHIPGELGECELCMSYGGSTAAISACNEQVIPTVASADPVQGGDAVAQSLTVHCIHARGPPRSS